MNKAFSKCGKNNKEFGLQLKYFIKKHVKNSQDTDDILQEVLIKIHRNIASLKDTEKCDAWVYRIARNTITDHYRKKKDLIVSTETIPDCSDEKPNDTPYQPEEIRKALKPFIEAMPEKYREAIYTIDYQGITQKDFANINDLSISGAKSRIQRARKLLKQSLFECCDFNLDKYGNVVDFTRK